MSQDFEVKQTLLKNGLKVLSLDLPWVNSIASGLFVKCGSRMESLTDNGISHFLEHLTFKGSRLYPDGLDIAREIESLGGVLNAYTTVDHTMYWNKVQSCHWQKSLRVLLDSVFYSTLPQEEIDREREVIFQEIARRDDTPSSLVWNLFCKTVWPEFSLGFPTLGTKEILKKIDREILLTYRRRHYRCDRMVLVVVGKVNHNEIIDFVCDFLSDWREESKDPLGIQKVSFSQKSPQFGYLEKEVEQVNLVLGCQGSSIFSEDRYALSVLNTVLGSGMSSRLFEIIREKLGLAYVISSYDDLFEDAGFLAVYAGVSPDKVSLVSEKIIEELARTKKEMISEKELAEAKEKICGPLSFALESTGGWMKFLGPRMLLKGEVITVPELIQRYQRVTREEVMQVARNIFTNNRLNLAIVGKGLDQDKCKQDLSFLEIDN